MSRVISKVLEKERNMHENYKYMGLSSKGWNEFHEYIKNLICGEKNILC